MRRHLAVLRVEWVVKMGAGLGIRNGIRNGISRADGSVVG
jgi:hypothetical protein